MKKIEVLRCRGYSISLDEEAYRTKLENIQRELNLPNQFKGRLNELAALIRMQEDRPMEEYETLDEESLENIHNVSTVHPLCALMIFSNLCISSWSNKDKVYPI
jgi:hypothetical protein